MEKMVEALKLLLELVQGGQEFPDALTKVCLRFRLNLTQRSELIGDYDSYCSEN